MSILSYSVNRVSISLLVVLFIFYIVSHYLLLKRKSELLNKANKVEQDEKDLKFISILADWFPAIYVVVVIMVLYMV